MSLDGYYSEQELKTLGIKFGTNVVISNKVSIYCKNLEIGSHVRIDDFCILTGSIKIGSFVHIASFCQLSGKSDIIIEDFCATASRTLLYSQSDDYSGAFMTNPMINEKYTNVRKGKIVMKKHTIIGAGSIILPKVTLEEGTAIGAFSLVNKDTHPWSIYFGIPAKWQKERERTILKLEPDFLESMRQ